MKEKIKGSLVMLAKKSLLLSQHIVLTVKNHATIFHNPGTRGQSVIEPESL